MNSKLDHYVHGIGLVLRKGYALRETVRQQRSDNNGQTTGESVMVNVNSHSFQQVVLSLL